MPLKHLALCCLAACQPMRVTKEVEAPTVLRSSDGSSHDSSDTGCGTPAFSEHAYDVCCSNTFADQLATSLRSCMQWPGDDDDTEIPPCSASAISCLQGHNACGAAAADLALLFRGDCR